MAARKKAVLKKLFINDECTEWIWVRVVDAKTEVDFQLSLESGFLKHAKRGVPWRCLLTNGINEAAKRDRTLFPHPVVAAYTEGSKSYILTSVSSKRSRAYPVAVCYRHNFTKKLRAFDVISKKQFFEQFGDVPVEIRLKPPVRHVRNVEGDKPRPQPANKPKGEKRLVGAARRARDAGLLNLAHLGGPKPDEKTLTQSERVVL